MISFNNDYSEGAHERIIKRLLEINMEQNNGYTLDRYSESARNRIKKELGRDDADVHFFVGGTQTNLTIIAASLRPHQAVISADTGHINVHETGAIEATGHKVVVVPGVDGKVTPDQVIRAIKLHSDEHMVQPKMVYISNSTEIGSVYTKRELQNLRMICDQYNLYLFMDGARLGSAMCSIENDCTLQDYSRLFDAFYLGGTKNGALFGEAAIIINPAIKEDFRFLIKQRGGLLAKGFLLGVQFDELMKDGLWFSLAHHANQMAKKLQDGLIESQVPMMRYSTTNLIFPILTKQQLELLQKDFLFSVWEERSDGRYVVRLVTSWATKEEDVDSFLQSLQKITSTAR